MGASDGVSVVGGLDGWPGLTDGEDDDDDNDDCLEVGFRVVELLIGISEGLSVGSDDGSIVGILVD